MKRADEKTTLKAACLWALLLATGLVTACGDSSSANCPGGTWATLELCIDAKIEAGVDDECNCFLNNDDRWEMEPDD